MKKLTYYYAAFSHDDLKNYSAFTEAATWKYTVTTGVDGNKRVDFTVAPNPVREYVTVIFPGDSVSELSVINSQGEIVMREKLKESVTSLACCGVVPRNLFGFVEIVGQYISENCRGVVLIKRSPAEKSRIGFCRTSFFILNDVMKFFPTFKSL